MEGDDEGLAAFGGGMAAMDAVVSLVRRLQAENLARWADTPVGLTGVRAYYRGKARTCVDILKELGADE